MFVGARFRKSPETPSSLKTTIGAALIGAALVGGSLGVVNAQESSPEASPMASPVATIDWIEQVPMEDDIDIDDDSAAVGVILEEPPVINAVEIEFRPYLILQTANNTDVVHNVAVFAVPADFDATTFTFPADEASLPEGVTPVGGFQVEPDDQAPAVFQDLAEGTYVLATDGGFTIAFAVIPVAELDVPDLFATPGGTPESTPAS